MARPVGYLLDTNVLVALIRANTLGEAIDQRFGLHANINRSMICIVTVGEMLSLARQFGWGAARRNDLEELLDDAHLAPFGRSCSSTRLPPNHPTALFHIASVNWCIPLTNGISISSMVPFSVAWDILELIVFSDVVN